MNFISIETAVGYLQAGLSTLPAVRARKFPAIGKWKKWSGRLPTKIEVECWFANRHDGVCIVAGKVSGNLECIDFDNKGELYEAWKAKVPQELMSGLVVERTPSGGYHVLYRVRGRDEGSGMGDEDGGMRGGVVEGNLKLARGERGGKLVTLIETRGEGGLFLCSPTEGYELIQGKMESLHTIEPVDRETLLNAARALDETTGLESPPRASAVAVRPTGGIGPGNATRGVLGGFAARPGDDFAERGDVRPFLANAGWQYLGTHPDGNELWRRPGKASGGHSATFDGKVFYVFSSNADPFESGRGYNQFQTYALLEHRGDFTRAAATLLELGYGKRDEGRDLGNSGGGNVVRGVDLGPFLANAGVVGRGDSGAVALVAQPQSVQTGEDEEILIGDLVERYPKMRPVLIHGFLRLGETMNIIAPPKTGKSWLVTDLALAVATGTEWFGFPCEKGKVLIIDNELHPETSAARVPKVIQARGFDMADVGDRIAIFNQRGKLKTIEDIANRVERYRQKEYKLIIVDAFYRAMPRGVDENDNGAIADVYNFIDRLAAEIGCAFCLIHHTSKGNQSLKSVTDVGSGAGSQSRAADTHVVLRRHREKGVVVMESVVRSFKGVDPVCLRWNWPLWNRDDSVDPADLDGKAELGLGRKRGSEEACETEQLVERVRELVKPGESPLPKTAFTTLVQKTYDTSRTTARMIVDEAIDLGYLKCERTLDADRGQRSTKFVLLGDRRPETEAEDED